MGKELRWVAIAMIMGLCTAYAMWGDRGAAPLPPPAVAPKTPAPPHTPVKTPSPAVTPAAVLPASALRFNPPQVDFGEVLVGQTKTTTVAVTNSGSTPLTIGSLTGSCGCLKAEMLKRKLEPGTSESLQLSYVGLSGTRPEKYLVTLITDEPGQPNVKLDASAKVKQEFTMQPEQLFFERIPKGESKIVEATLIHNDGTPVMSKDILCPRREFSFNWEKATPNGSAYRIIVVMKGLQSGAITEGVAIHTDHPLLPVVSFNVIASVIGGVSATPSVLSATQTPSRKATPFETVLKRSPIPGQTKTELAGGLQILSITESDGAALKFEAERLDPDTVRVSIRLDEEFTRNPAVGEFVIRTNAEEDPMRLPFRVLRPGPPMRTPVLSPNLRSLAPPPEQKIQVPLLPPQPRGAPVGPR